MLADYVLTKLDQQEWRRSKVIANIWQGGALTVSTSFWGYVYNILPETGLFDINLSRVLNQLSRQNLIEISENGLVKLTDIGATHKAQYLATHYQPLHLEVNLNYDIKAFQDVFLLANQIISELSYKNKQYYPFQIDLRYQWQLKQWLRTKKRDVLITDWYQNLSSWLVTRQDYEAELFTAMLFGHNMPNKLFSELQLPLEWDEFDLRLWQIDCLASLMQYSLKNETVILEIMQLVNRSLLSSSAEQSARLLDNQLSLNEIARQRRIKITTVREHILHAAIIQNWNKEKILQLIPKEELVKLKSIFEAKDVVNWQYRIYTTSSNPVFFTYFRLYQLSCLQGDV